MPVSRDLKSVVRKVVRVRLPPSAPISSITYKQASFESELSQRSKVSCAHCFCSNCFVHLVRRVSHSIVKPPLQQREYFVGQVVRGNRNRHRKTQLWTIGQFSLEFVAQVFNSRLQHGISFSGAHQSPVKVLSLLKMPKHESDRKKRIATCSVPLNSSGNLVAQPLPLTRKQIFLIALVRIKRRASDRRPIDHVLSCDVVKTLLLNHLYDCHTQLPARALTAGIDFLSPSHNR